MHGWEWICGVGGGGLCLGGQFAGMDGVGVGCHTREHRRF
jgi:hypothetical protein